jgi:hypothetical protein
MIKQKEQKYGYNENVPGVHQRFWELDRSVEWVLGFSAPVRSNVTTEHSQVCKEPISWRI